MHNNHIDNVEIDLPLHLLHILEIELHVINPLGPREIAWLMAIPDLGSGRIPRGVLRTAYGHRNTMRDIS